MTIHMLVEGPSERVLFERWSRRLLQAREVRLHPHQGKGSLPRDLDARPDLKRRGLLDQLPAKLRGFANSMDVKTDQVVILVDVDGDDPTTLLGAITGAVVQVAPDLPVMVQLAVEETEAFYLGDLGALRKAFPAADLRRARSYEPDSVCGTWELFAEIVGDPGANKVGWAEAMGPLLTTKVGVTRSPSFKALIKGLLALKPRMTKKRRSTYRHPVRPRHDSGRRR
jgi:Domain of unknown function (DUF4276)